MLRVSSLMCFPVRHARLPSLTLLARKFPADFSSMGRVQTPSDIFLTVSRRDRPQATVCVVCAPVVLDKIVTEIVLFSSVLLSSSIRKRLYPQHPPGQAVVTGVFPSPPRYYTVFTRSLASVFFCWHHCSFLVTLFALVHFGSLWFRR